MGILDRSIFEEEKKQNQMFSPVLCTSRIRSGKLFFTQGYGYAEYPCFYNILNYYLSRAIHVDLIVQEKNLVQMTVI